MPKSLFGRRRTLVCRIRDDSGALTLRLFYFSASQQKQLKPGQIIRCFGQVRHGFHGLEIIHPEYTLDPKGLPPETHLTPIYPTTDGLSQKQFRQLFTLCLETLKDHTIEELLPTQVKQQHQFCDLQQALELIHNPPKTIDPSELSRGEHPLIQRLAFEEILAHHLGFLKLRQSIQTTESVPLAQAPHTELMAQLPFALTRAQQRVSQEISQDLEKNVPMLRLVQGDVGSGKTVVAAMALWQAVHNQTQAAFMAPTELLAEQHRVTLTQWFEPLGVKVDWLSSKLKGQKRADTYQRILTGEAQIIVGTQALFQEALQFKCLSLVIIDEQHRFGVDQRMALRDKSKRTGFQAHQLIMTATPIPRTLAMSVYVDLDTSVIDELPSGRLPVETRLLPDTRRDQVVERIHAACQTGKQVLLGLYLDR